MLEKKARELSVSQERKKNLQEKIIYLKNQAEEKNKGFIYGIDSEEKITEKINEIEKEIVKAGEETEQKQKEQEEKEKQLIETKKGFLVNQKRMQEISENSGKLLKSASECPVCSTKLSKEKKIEIVSSYEKEETRIKIINKSLQEEEQKILKEIEEIKTAKKEKEKLISLKEEEKNRINSLKERIKELNAIKKEIQETETEKTETEKKMNELEKEKPEEKITETENRIRETEKITELIKEKEKMVEWKKELEETIKEKNRINYEENSFSRKKEETSSIKNSIEFTEKEIKANKELKESIQENINKIEKEKERINELQKEINSQEKIVSELVLFNNALSETQAELRKEMIDTINDAMDDVWNRIYPYKDFTSIKMEIEEGNYEIKVKEKNGKWTRVEGILSGGERSIAAICIRVAFSLVLTQNLSWLILDEPTHNLDRNSVAELSLMMKEHLPNLVEQIFVITHDPEMEKAASGSCYEIERDKENEKSSVPKLQE